MTLTDYLVDTLLVLLVFRQIRETRYTRRTAILPLVIIAWAMQHYLHAIPTSGNDVPLIVALTAVGLACGTVSALSTRVRTDGGRYALVKAGWLAAGIWVASMGARFGFVVWATHGGGASLARFGIAHSLSAEVWTAALVLMALGEVLARTGVLVLRTRRALAASRAGARDGEPHRMVTA